MTAHVIRLQLSATQHILWHHPATVGKIGAQVVSDNITGRQAAMESKTAHQVVSYSNCWQDWAACCIRQQQRTAQVIRLQLEATQHVRWHNKATVGNKRHQMVFKSSTGCHTATLHILRKKTAPEGSIGHLLISDYNTQLHQEEPYCPMLPPVAV